VRLPPLRRVFPRDTGSCHDPVGNGLQGQERRGFLDLPVFLEGTGAAFYSIYGYVFFGVWGRLSQDGYSACDGRESTVEAIPSLVHNSAARRGPETG
jgi:hypothetical protein